MNTFEIHVLSIHFEKYTKVIRNTQYIISSQCSRYQHTAKPTKPANKIDSQR